MTGWYYPRTLGVSWYHFTTIYKASDVLWSYEWHQLITWQPFFTRRCAQESVSVWDIFLANPRSLLDVIEWLVGIQECLECHLILLPSYSMPLMCCEAMNGINSLLDSHFFQEGAPRNRPFFDELRTHTHLHSSSAFQLEITFKTSVRSIYYCALCLWLQNTF